MSWRALWERLRRGDEFERVRAPRSLRGEWARIGKLQRRLEHDPEAASPLILACEDLLARLDPDGDRRFRGAVLHCLGSAYKTLPRTDRVVKLRNARRCLEEAAACFRDADTPRRYAEVQRQLGDVIIALPEGSLRQRLFDAVTAYNKALGAAPASTMPDRHAAIHDSIGMTLCHPMLAAKARRDALNCLLRALEHRKRDRSSEEYAATLLNLGRYYLRFHESGHDDLAEAKRCLQEALGICQRRGLHRQVAMAHYLLGAVLAEAPDAWFALWSSPESHYQEALKHFSPHATPGEFRAVQQALGDLHFSRRDWPRALAAYEAALEAGERLYQAGWTPAGRAFEMKANFLAFENAAFALAKLGRHADALLMLERGKARELSSALRLRVRRPAGVPDEPWERFERAAAALRAFAVPETFSPGSMLRIEREAAALSAAIDDAAQEVQRHAPHFLRSAGVPEMLKIATDGDCAVVATCVTTQGTAVFLLHPDLPEAPRVIEIDGFGQKQLAELLQHDDAERPNDDKKRGWLPDYAGFLKERSEKTFASWLESFDRALEILGRELLAPVVDALPERARELLILPSGLLYLLPLHAARLPQTGAHLCDRFVVRYTPSADVLQRRSGHMERPGSLYAVVNPEEDPSLNLADFEAEQAASMFPAAQIDRGRAATPRRVLRRLGSADYVHFVCHGEYDWFDPAESSLRLSQGRLTMADVSAGGMDLSNVQVVTLSACESGITDVLLGSPQEYVGIPAAFLVGGARCVVSSLWAVPDAATGLLMRSLYDNHVRRGLGLPSALSQAQDWLRNLPASEAADLLAPQIGSADSAAAARAFKEVSYLRHLAAASSPPPYSHPYFWAAFTVNGL